MNGNVLISVKSTDCPNGCEYPEIQYVVEVVGVYPSMERARKVAQERAGHKLDWTRTDSGSFWSDDGILGQLIKPAWVEERE